MCILFFRLVPYDEEDEDFHTFVWHQFCIGKVNVRVFCFCCFLDGVRNCFCMCILFFRLVPYDEEYEDLHTFVWHQFCTEKMNVGVVFFALFYTV